MNVLANVDFLQLWLISIRYRLNGGHSRFCLKSSSWIEAPADRPHSGVRMRGSKKEIIIIIIINSIYHVNYFGKKENMHAANKLINDNKIIYNPFYNSSKPTKTLNL